MDSGRMARRAPAAPVNPNVAVESHTAAAAASTPANVASAAHGARLASEYKPQRSRR